MCENNLYHDIDDTLGELNADILALQLINEPNSDIEIQEQLQKSHTSIQIVDAKQIMGLYISRHKNYHEDSVEYYKGIGESKIYKCASKTFQNSCKYSFNGFLKHIELLIRIDTNAKLDIIKLDKSRTIKDQQAIETHYVKFESKIHIENFDEEYFLFDELDKDIEFVGHWMITDIDNHLLGNPHQYLQL
ncbi:UNKNOWN [Stylonychia lemnae]|uniref:Uncharacterized protein n=1 Tax=Stylonychia lemnae TaxID=5949 RepID=A0A078AQE2_STYLE|nr:UNKNOWN [Stylonychia lemnae]|eukprot:CDW83163.1 UNKNOWN [Stylonychia lemnae]